VAAKCRLSRRTVDFYSPKSTIVNKPFMGGQDAHPTRRSEENSLFVGTGILPVLENGAISQFLRDRIFLLQLNKGGRGSSHC